MPVSDSELVPGSLLVVPWLAFRGQGLHDDGRAPGWLKYLELASAVDKESGRKAKGGEGPMRHTQ